MTGVIAQSDQIADRYRSAWRALYHSDPPIIREGGLGRVSIISDDGTGDPMSAQDFRRRIEDMETWVGASS